MQLGDCNEQPASLSRQATGVLLHFVSLLPLSFVRMLLKCMHVACSCTLSVVSARPHVTCCVQLRAAACCCVHLRTAACTCVLFDRRAVRARVWATDLPMGSDASCARDLGKDASLENYCASAGRALRLLEKHERICSTPSRHRALSTSYSHVCEHCCLALAPPMHLLGGDDSAARSCKGARA